MQDCLGDSVECLIDEMRLENVYGNLSQIKHVAL